MIDIFVLLLSTLKKTNLIDVIYYVSEIKNVRLLWLIYFFNDLKIKQVSDVYETKNVMRF